MLIEFKVKKVSDKKLRDCGFTKDNDTKRYIYRIVYSIPGIDKELPVAFSIDLAKGELWITFEEGHTAEVNSAFQISEDIKYELLRLEKLNILQIVKYE